jgi:hypothetical protein
MRVFLPLLILCLLTVNGEAVLFWRQGSMGPAVITTATYINDSGSTLPAGTPISFGRGFRDGDIPAGTYPVIRDAATHAVLAGQQWDEIATRSVNGGDGSWLHAVWAVWLPNSLANGATYQVEFIARSGTYSETSHQALSVLCSGPAAHDLKIHLTDVRNQDDSLRNSGDATFDICSNIANTGRDAPRHLRAGNVYDEYEVSGLFMYATTGQQDPLLYAQCIVDIFTKTDGTSPGDVRWVCHVHNSWENVSSGSAGTGPGPVGFPNDPQFISFRTEVDDGSTDVLDWSGLDATVSSASNPVVNAAVNSCNANGETVCINIPSSTGANAWYLGQASRVTSTGTPIGGLTNGGLTWIWPSGTATTNSSTGSQFINPMITPYFGETFPLTSSQGSGSTTFSARQVLYHFNAFQTLDSTGQDNWSPIGTTTRVTRKVYPAFTAAEAQYWEESGVILPINRAQTVGTLGPRWNLGGGVNYEPEGAMNITGGTGGGTRPDLGVSGEYAAKAWVTQAQGDWDLARLFTLGTTIQGFATMLDEESGRISPLNDGPPVGAGGNGTGGTYAGLGPLRNQIAWTLPQNVPVQGLAQPLDFVPNACCHYAGGGQPSNGSSTGFGTSLDHMPSFDGFTYLIFGDRHWLDLIQWQANAMFAQQRVGPGPELGQGFYRDNNAKFTNGNTYHYWGLLTVCCQGRGSAWLIRDVEYAAAFGADSAPEKQYFNDLLTETGNYWPLFLKYRDGPASTGYSASIYPPGEPDTVGGGALTSGFVAPGYIGGVSYNGEVWLRVPMFSTWNTKLQYFYEGVCGGVLAGSTGQPDFWCAQEDLMAQIHDGGATPTGFGGNVGQYMNGTDASDWGSWSVYGNLLAGGQVGYLGFGAYPVEVGDTIHLIYNGWDGGHLGASTPIDQLSGTRWYTVIGPVCNGSCSGYQHTFYVQCNSSDHTNFPTQCPTAGAAFTGFTQSTTPVTPPLQVYPVFRYQYDPGAGQGYADPNYSDYMGALVNGLTIMGFDTSSVSSKFQSRCNLPSDSGGCYNPSLPSLWWDPTIVVPGLPPAVNGT